VTEVEGVLNTGRKFGWFEYALMFWEFIWQPKVKVA